MRNQQKKHQRNNRKLQKKQQKTLETNRIALEQQQKIIRKSIKQTKEKQFEYTIKIL